MEANKRLYRSNRNKMICGVCGGVAEYFNIDPTIVRLVFAILAFSCKIPSKGKRTVRSL